MQALLQLLQVGDVLRVQLVQLVLQILELLFDGGLAVELLVILLLGGAHLVAHLHELQVLIEHLFQHLKASGLAVLGKHGVALLALAGHPRGEPRGNVAHRRPEGGIDPQRRHPGLALTKGQHRLLHGGHALFGVRRIQILDIRAAGELKLDGLVRLDADLADVDAAAQLDDHKALGVRIPHDAGHAAGVEALRRDLRAGHGLLCHDQHDLGVLHRLPPGHAAVVVGAKINRRIRHGDSVMYG